MQNKRRRQGARAAVLVAAILACGLAAGAARAAAGAEYRLGLGDQVQLSVLQADLDRTLTVRPDGSVIVPLVGAVPVAGLTVREAEDLIRQRLRLFNREIGDVSLTVTQYNALRVSVLGAVTRAGEYTFQTPPSLWDAVRVAGGTLPTANLSMVRIVREEAGQAQTEVHDISALVTGQGRVEPVTLRAGDTVIVPTREEASAAPSANTVQVIGSVLRPGSLQLSEPTALISVLLMAGGTIETSDISSVTWVRPGAGGSRARATAVDLNDFYRKGLLAGNPTVNPGDTVQVPYRRAGFFSTFWPILLSTLTAGTAIMLASRR